MNNKILHRGLKIVTVFWVFASVASACIPPTARICAPDPKYAAVGVNPAAGKWLTIDGSCSSDDGTIVKYEWDFNGNDFYEYYETSTFYPDGIFDGEHTSYYTQADTYTAKLRVTDNDGLTDVDTCTVHAVEIKVVAPKGAPAWVHVDDTLPLDSEVKPAGLAGSYNWSKGIGPGTVTFSPSSNVEDPWFSADEHGTYSASVEYNIDGVTVSHITGHIYVVEVELFRDLYNKVLDDWPAQGGKPRSPKYLFRKDDPIYVRVEYYAPLSDTTEYYQEAVKVTSASDPTGIYLDVKEFSDNTLHCYNDLADNELLYLANSSSDSPTEGDTIEVADEEVLTFYLEVPPQSGTYIESTSVMVDRAEVAAVDGTPTLDAAEFHGDMVADDFFSVEPQGLYDKNNSPGAGDDDKCVELGNKADIMYVAGHCSSGDNPTRIFGASGYGLGPQGNSDNLQPSDVGTWDEELEWLVLACCSTMNIDPVTKTGLGTQWVGTMDGTGRGHAIMGYRDGAPGGTTQTTDVEIADEFVYKVTLGDRNVTGSWMSANFDHKNADRQGDHFYSPLNAVAIGRYDNGLDCIGTSVALDNFVSRDSTDNDWCYTWIYWEYDDQCPGNVSTDPPPEFSFFDYP